MLLFQPPTWRSQASDTNLLIMSARRAGLRGRRGAAQPTPQDPVSVDNIVQALAPAMAALSAAHHYPANILFKIQQGW